MCNALKYFLKPTSLTSLVCLATSACAMLGSGNIPVPRATGYRVTAPHQWKVLEQPESDRAYRLPSGDIATLDSSCNQQSKAPLEILTRDLLLGDRDVHYADRHRLTVDGTEGLFSSVTATLNGAPFHFRFFVLSKGGCVFDFSLISPKAIPPAETEEFLRFVNSFKYGT